MHITPRNLIIVLLLAVSLVGAYGCAKKQTGTEPGMTAEEQARQQEEEARRKAEEEAYRQRELEEEARRRAEEERQRQMGQEDAKMALEEMIFFDFDSYELSAKSREVLQAKAAALKANPNMKMVVEGYCDERGTEEYNLALGERRARAAYEFLVLLGVSPTRLSIVSYGEENPLDPSNTEAAWAKNRRCEFKTM